MDKSNYEVFYTDVRLITYVSLVFVLITLSISPVEILYSYNGKIIPTGLILILAPLFLLFLSLDFIIVVAIFVISHMRYELHETELLIVFGPWKERVPYGDIVNVSAKDLSLNLISSFRLPGLALFDVLYSDEGTVRMYSTHALKDVVLIETLKKKYGISPKDKEGFLSSLEKHLKIHIAYAPEQHEKPVAERGSKSFIAFIFWGIIIAQFVVLVAFQSRLPQKMVIHWDFQGNPNGFAQKFWGLFGTELVFLPAWLLPLFMKGKNKQYTYETLTPFAVLAGLVQIFIILTNLGYKINDRLVIALAILLSSLTIIIAIVRAPKTKK
jgi:hypothetical protein